MGVMIISLEKELVVFPLMISLMMVMLDIFSKGDSQTLFPKANKPGEAFLFYTSSRTLT